VQCAPAPPPPPALPAAAAAARGTRHGRAALSLAHMSCCPSLPCCPFARTARESLLGSKAVTGSKAVSSGSNHCLAALPRHCLAAQQSLTPRYRSPPQVRRSEPVFS